MLTKQICGDYLCPNNILIKFMRLVPIAISFLCAIGCTMFRYPPVEKELFSWVIKKGEVATIKNTILSEGYVRVGKDNYRYEGAIVTQYRKEISTPATRSRVQIMLNFKEVDASSDVYRNMGIRIFVSNGNGSPEINEEVDKIEGTLYKKLIEVAGNDNVVKGKR